MNLLVVDDDRETCDLIARFFKPHGYAVSAAHDGSEMEERLKRERFDVIVLDVMLPGKDGLTLCRELRAASPVPIIMLTAINEPADRIVGLEIGADDYIAKPFEPRELLARVRALIRRLHSNGAAERPGSRTQSYGFAGWMIDMTRRRLTAPDGVLITLTTAEFDLLAAFVTHPQRTLSRDRLLDLTRGRSAQPFDRSIDILVSRLRRKLDDDSSKLIVTMRGDGYMFVPDVVAL